MSSTENKHDIDGMKYNGVIRYFCKCTACNQLSDVFGGHESTSQPPAPVHNGLVLYMVSVWLGVWV